MTDARPLTRDTLFEGKLFVCQEERGYRFSLDAVLLAGLTQIKTEDRIIELGTGCGVVPLILAFRKKTNRRITALEIQPELAAIAHSNVRKNGLEAAVEVVQTDFRESASSFDAGSFDLVLSNPPYRKPGTGRINPEKQKAIARHELTATLPDVFRTAKHLLPPGGRVALVYPASRLGHLMHSAAENDFAPKRLTVIHSHPGGPGKLIHLECNKGGGEELRVDTPFYIYDGKGSYSPEMQKLYEQET